MHRQPLLELLQAYADRGFGDTSDERRWRQLTAFVRSTPDCFLRSHQEGHLTASGLIADRPLERILLMHHRKLDKWLQLGGHADGETDLGQVALKEGREESGLASLDLLDPIPYDLDIHPIPARGDVPEHLHYDVRFFMVTDHPHTIQANPESKGLRWLSLEQARQLTSEPSMLRQFDRFQRFRQEALSRSGTALR